MRVLIAPDKFKDALAAVDVARAMAAGVLDFDPAADVELCPMGDGGEGTGALLARAAAAETRTVLVRDPLGREREARWWHVAECGEAIIEMAEASGLGLLTEAERDPERTTSYGTGQLIRSAVDAGCKSVLVCVGGSATVDGGAGALQALGWRLLDSDGGEIREPVTGAVLRKIAQLVPPSKPLSAACRVLCDVVNPLLGPEGAARVYSPQKGAASDQVVRLEEGLRFWVEKLHRAIGRDASRLPGAGAAGGLAGGLAAALDAELVPGFAEVARRLDLQQKARACDLCLTGEGRIDAQTAAGKVVCGVGRLAKELGIPSLAFAGQADTFNGTGLAALAARVDVDRIVVITPESASVATALRETAENVRRAVREALAARS